MCFAGRTGNCPPAQKSASAPDRPRSARLGHRMRRSTRLGLAIVGALLVIAGGYAGYWFIIAGQIERGVIAWARSARADKIEISWQNFRSKLLRASSQSRKRAGGTFG